MAGRWPVIPKLVWLTSVAPGQRNEFVLNCIDPDTLVLAALPKDRTVVGHVLAGPRNTIHRHRHGYAVQHLGTFELLRGWSPRADAEPSFEIERDT